jgi:hypothetical protein
MEYESTKEEDFKLDKESQESRDESDTNDFDSTHETHSNEVSSSRKWVLLPNVIVKNPVAFPIILMLVGFFLFFIIVLILFYGGVSNQFEYIAPRCKTMMVTLDDEEGPESLSLEQYIISHIYSATKEMEEANAKLYQTLAIVVNTEVQLTGVCSKRYDPEVDDIYEFEILAMDHEKYLEIEQAIQNVKDLVMVDKNTKQYYQTSLDGFCYNQVVEDEQNELDSYYTLAQLDYAFPTSWVQEHVKSFYFTNCACNNPDPSIPKKENVCYESSWHYSESENPELIYVDGGSGTGISIYGAYYLTTVENRSYDAIFRLFYPDQDWVLMSTDESLKGKNHSDYVGLGGYGYIAPKCTEITTTTKTSESGGQGSGSAVTLSIEDYVKGVVYHEFRGANNLEAYKAMAVAARSYVLANIGNNCTINNSTATQTFTAEEDRSDRNADALIADAVMQTKGIVVTNGSTIKRTEYDAFCFASKDSNYYTMLQGEYGNGGQQIPTSWVEANIHSSTYKNCPCNNSAGAPSSCYANGKYRDGGHGRGMSQYGMLYLASVEGFSYQNILNYYYGNDIVLKSIYYSSANTDGSTSSTQGTTELHEPLLKFLLAHGSSVADLNQIILDRVLQSGVGTANGVVGAALGLVDTLATQYQIRLPYYYSGGHSAINGVGRSVWSFYGVDPDWGTKGPFYYAKYGMYPAYGPDCSAFVAWAMKNAGISISSVSTSSSFLNLAGVQNVSLLQADFAEIKPGDLLHHPGHIELIISVDPASNMLKTAEASGKNGGLRISNRSKVSSSSYNYTIIRMNGYYETHQTPDFVSKFQSGLLN